MPFEEAGRALSEDDMFSDPAGLVSAAIVILLWIFTCFCICSRDGGGESVPAQVAPSASTSEPEPKPEPEEPECKVLFISDVCGFGVPAGSSDIYVSFTLEGQNEVGKTAALANAAEPVWFGRPLISVPGDFKTGSLKVAIWEEDAKKGGAPICSAVVSLDVAELPKTFEKVDGKVSFKICTMGIEAALKLKAEAGKVIKAEKAKQEAEKQAKAKEAAKAKAAHFAVEVYDKDLTDDDDRLASAITPPAVLTLSGISAKDIPLGIDRGSKKGFKKADPYLKFALMEVGDFESKARLSTCQNSSNPTWKESVELQLPRASPRPPMINIRLWDDDQSDADDPIASTDVRLSGSGEATATLPIRKGLVKKGAQKVQVALKFAIAEEEGY